MKNNTLKNYLRLLLNARKKPYQLFRDFLGFYPFDVELYKLALLNKSSFAKDKHGNLINNERLEFLGDAVLEAVVTDILYHRYPKQKEGFLTILRSRIVQRKMLNKLGMQIGLNRLAKAATVAKPFNIYGNTLEALIGAIYLDRGYPYAQMFVERILKKHVRIDKLSDEESNFKVKVQDWAQKNKMSFTYLIKEDENPKSNVFVAELYVEGILVGSGEAFSKKEAQQRAAEVGFRKLTPNNPVMKEIKEKKNQLQAEQEQEPTTTEELPTAVEANEVQE